MLRVIEYFAKSLKVTQGHSKCQPRVCETFNVNSTNAVILKSGLEVIQGYWKWHHSTDCIQDHIGVPL